MRNVCTQPESLHKIILALNYVQCRSVIQNTRTNYALNNFDYKPIHIAQPEVTTKQNPSNRTISIGTVWIFKLTLYQPHVLHIARGHKLNV